MDNNDDWFNRVGQYATERPLCRVDRWSPTGLITLSSSFFAGSIMAQKSGKSVFYKIHPVDGDLSIRQLVYRELLKKLKSLQAPEQVDDLIWWLVSNQILNIRDIADELNEENDNIQAAYDRVRPKQSKSATSRHSEKNRWKASLFDGIQVPSNGFVLNKPITWRVLAKKLDDDGFFVNFRRKNAEGIRRDHFTSIVEQIRVYFVKWGVAMKAEETIAFQVETCWRNFSFAFFLRKSKILHINIYDIKEFVIYAYV